MTVDTRAIPLPLASDNINVMPKVEPDLVHLVHESPTPGARHSRNRRGSNEHERIVFQFKLQGTDADGRGEFSAFISAVKELLGPEQVELSAVDWLDELELMDSPPGSTSRHWRAVTIAASARLAGRLSIIPHHARRPVASTDTKV